MPVYTKLVRDHIPQIIEENGRKCTTKILSEDQYITSLHEKMKEELDEYVSVKTHTEALEELADILELVHAASTVLGANIEVIEKMRREKALMNVYF